MSSKSGSRILRGAFASLLGAAAIAVVAPAGALGACAQSPDSSPFAQFGDESSYVLAPGGSFESGAPGWTLSGAAVTSGNESFEAVPGTHSLALGPGATAASPWVCIGSEYPTFRFFARRTSGSGPLLASLRWVNLLGITVETQAGTMSASGAWAPSPVMKLGDSLPLWLPGSTLDIQLVFRSDSGSSWSIDDVFIDPYRR